VKVADAFSGVRSLFLDTAPLIYYVENVAPYRKVMDGVVARVESGALFFVTSPITLAECLVHPLRRGDAALTTSFRLAVTAGINTRYVGVDAVAEQAAELRARLNLTLTDALQVACSLANGCDAFLTNDRMLARVSGLRAIVVSDLEPD
jgi:predicted nucleic acid-binding protein